MTIAAILSRPLAASAQCDRTWFLDHGQHRLRLVGASLIASHRDGRSFRLPWPKGEPVPSGEAIAAHIFSIAKKTTASLPAGGR